MRAVLHRMDGDECRLARGLLCALSIMNSDGSHLAVLHKTDYAQSELHEALKLLMDRGLVAINGTHGSTDDGLIDAADDTSNESDGFVPSLLDTQQCISTHQLVQRCARELLSEDTEALKVTDAVGWAMAGIMNRFSNQRSSRKRQLHRQALQNLETARSMLQLGAPLLSTGSVEIIASGVGELLKNSSINVQETAVLNIWATSTSSMSGSKQGKRPFTQSYAQQCSVDPPALEAHLPKQSNAQSKKLADLSAWEGKQDIRFYHAALHLCSTLSQIGESLIDDIEGKMSQMGLSFDLNCHNARLRLISITLREPDKAQKLLDDLIASNRIIPVAECFRILIRGWKSRVDIESANGVFEQMLELNIPPDYTTRTALIEAWGHCKKGRITKKDGIFITKQDRIFQIMNEQLASKDRIQNTDDVVCSAIINLGYAPTCATDAEAVFAWVLKNEEVPLSSEMCGHMITNWSQAKDPSSAQNILQIMKEHSVEPTIDTFSRLVQTWHRAKEPKRAQDMLRIAANEANLMPNADMFAKVIESWGHYGQPEKSEETFQMMFEMCVAPNNNVFGSLIQAWQSDPERAEKVLDSMKKFGFAPDITVFFHLIRVWAKAKQAAKSEDVLQKMKEAGVRPDAETFRQIVIACEHSRNSAGRTSLGPHESVESSS